MGQILGQRFEEALTALSRKVAQLNLGNRLVRNVDFQNVTVALHRGRLNMEFVARRNREPLVETREVSLIDKLADRKRRFDLGGLPVDRGENRGNLGVEHRADLVV